MARLEEAHLQNESIPNGQGQPTETTPLLPGEREQEQPGKYSVFTNSQKHWIILTAALASSFSPFSANIYYPALNSIAEDLGVSKAQINLTITTYMICQGLAPTFMGSLADQAGRRPAYILCFIIYISGNIALALQHSYPALLVLRAVQSCGSSGTVALASAVAADIITSAERGMYMGIASLGNILAPSIGPILGGLLSQYLGWQAVFWFLCIMAAVFFVPFLTLFPETCREIVGDGSLEASRWWNMSILQCFGRMMRQKQREEEVVDDVRSDASGTKISFPNPLSTLRLLLHLPTGPLLLANGIVFASYYAVTSGMPAQFKEMYRLEDLGIGLSFIPAGLGSLCSAICNGTLVDWNYRRMKAASGQAVSKDARRQDHEDFPIERARLQIGLPMTLAASMSVATYGFLIEMGPPLAVALLMVFVISFCITAAYNVMNILIVDLHYSTPATAMAANNLMRCFLGAGAAAMVNPMIERWGCWWTYFVVATCMVGVSPLLISVYERGPAWRTRRGS